LGNNIKNREKIPVESSIDNVSIVDEIEGEEGAPAWIITFADMVTLLLVFFILLFTIATVEAKKFQLVMASIQSALHQEDPAANQIVQPNISTSSEPEETMYEVEEADVKDHENKLAEKNDLLSAEQQDGDKQQLLIEAQELIKEQRLGEHIYAYADGNKVILRIKGTMLFNSGNVDLIEKSEIIFEDIDALFKKYADYKIDIKGYTDNRPIETKRFPSNWELSAIRATTVLRYFVNRGIDPTRLSATGYADLFPIADNSTIEGRAQNRRVEFVLEKQEK